MKCPTCDDQLLVVTERAGIEVDVCPQRQGIWLDRGEIGRLVVMHAPELSSSPGVGRP